MYKKINTFTYMMLIFFISTSTVAFSAETTEIKVGGPPNIAMLVLVAQAKGFFNEEKVNVKYVHLQTGKIAQDALSSGDIDLGILVDSNIAFVNFQEGNDVKVIAAIEEKNDDSLLYRKDKIKSIADLKGKKIAYLPATTSHVYLERFLSKNNIPFNKIKPVSLLPAAMIPALIKGDVDAISIWQPFIYNAQKQLGENAGEFSDKEAYTAYALLASKSNNIIKYSAEYQSILKALIKAEEFVKNQPNEAITILATAIPMDEKILATIWDKYKLQVRLDKVILSLLQEEGTWISKSQRAFKGKPVPNYANKIDATVLKAVAPDRVSIE